MTHAEARRFLKRVSYKPGSRFVIDFMGDKPYLKIITTRVNTGKRHGKIRLQTWSRIPGGPIRLDITEAQLLQKARLVVRAQENHERDEWLRVDGEMLRDPHTGRRHRVTA